jgi:hypothetical protein
MNWGLVSWNVDSLRAQISDMQYRQMMERVTPFILDGARSMAASLWLAGEFYDALQIESDLSRWADDGGA